MFREVSKDGVSADKQALGRLLAKVRPDYKKGYRTLENYLRKSLDYAFGGIDGIPAIPTTILFCQKPEILASNPNNRNYRPEVAEALKKARERLKKNDLLIFGSK